MPLIPDIILIEFARNVGRIMLKILILRSIAEINMGNKTFDAQVSS